MAQQQQNVHPINELSRLDPVWARIREEAEQVVQSERELASFILSLIHI